MSEMKSLTINGVRYTAKDEGSVRYDEAQQISDEEKAQARDNTGSTTVQLMIWEEGD